MVKKAQTIIVYTTLLFREGHTTMIDEIKEQLHGNTPDTIVVVVRGGGLMCRVYQGLLGSRDGMIYRCTDVSQCMRGQYMYRYKLQYIDIICVQYYWYT